MAPHQTDTENRLDERIPVDLTQPLVLEVHNPGGDVTVRAADRSDVLISHAMFGHSSDPGDQDPGLSIDAHENRITVRPIARAGVGWSSLGGDLDFDSVVGHLAKAFRRGGPWFSAEPGNVRAAFGRHAWPDIVIDVPRSMTGRVDVKTASGDVRLEDLTSEITVNSMSGAVRVARTSGPLVLQSASGDLAIEGTAGRINARTASGDVRVASARIDGFQVQTASGDLTLDAMLIGDTPCHAQTVSGDVRLTLRQAAADDEPPAATLAFRTLSGDAQVAHPFRQAERRLWQAGPGGRGPRIDVTTVSGDLSAAIARADSAFAAPASPAVSPDDIASAPADVARTDDDAKTPARAEATQAPADALRLSVLEAVERGEIDIEEALRQLEAADSTLSP